MTDPFNLRFEEAIDFFKRKTPLPSQSWDDFVNQVQDFAFTIAGVTGADLLNDSYNLITSAIENGDTYEDFKKGFNAAVERAGWTGLKPWRQSLMFSQNLSNAYQAGRYKQMTDPYLLKTRSAWIWRHNDSRVPRKTHLALDGKVFSATDKFWEPGYPPCGFGCRCAVFALSQRDLEREGLKVEEAPQETITIKDKKTGETQKLAAMTIDGVKQPIVEPGFNHTPGSSKETEREQILQKAIERLHPSLRAEVVKVLGQRGTS